MIKFLSLYAAREEYIIPLTKKFPCARNIDLSNIDVFRRGFESSYDSIFVKGCHIPRTPMTKNILSL